MTRALYVGNYRHPWCTEVHIARALEANGVEVDRFQEPEHATADTLDQIERRAADCNLVLWTRTWGLPPEATDLWRRLEANGTTTASYHLDLYVPLARGEKIETDPFWTTQHVFTPDGNPESEAYFAERGINHHWMPAAVVADECATVMPGRYREEFAYDVVFVGSYGYHDEWPWRPKLIDWLADTYGDRFRRFGGDTRPGPIRGQDLNDLYTSCKVVVGDSCFAHRGQRYWSDRPYEGWGRGAPMVFPGIDALRDQLGFYPGYQVGDYDSLRQGIEDGLLGSYRDAADVLARTIAEHHTYTHRLADVLLMLEKNVVTDRPVIELEHGEHVVHTSPIRLELGSGYHPTEGFTHLDVNPNAPGVDIVGPAFPLDLPDASVSELRAVDVLEHISYRLTDQVLADWARVLVPGGRLYVQVPDAHTIMAWFIYQPGLLVDRLPPELPQTALMGACWRLLGGQDDGVYAVGPGEADFNLHRAMFSETSLREALERAGFVIQSLEVNPHPNIQATAIRR